jgi:hypothetical protein
MAAMWHSRFSALITNSQAVKNMDASSDFTVQAAQQNI